MIWAAIGTVLLLAGNAFFVAAEFSLVAARRSALERRAEQSRPARLVLGMQDRLSFSLAGAQLGVTICSLGLGAVAEPLVGHTLEAALGSVHAIPESVSRTVSFLVALAIVTFLHMVFSEMVPKNLAIAEPVRSALVVGPAFRGFLWLTAWLVAVLNGLANTVLRIFGVDPSRRSMDVHTAEDLSLLLGESRERGLIEDFDHRLLRGALDFVEKDAGAAKVARPDVAALAVDSSVAEFEALVRATGHSRIPVFEGDLDHVVGFVHAKDLLAVDEASLDDPLPLALVRDLLVVPETRPLHPILLDMRARHVQLALVVDEHGGTAGIVTIEDILEELVGEIRDEYDRRERLVRPLGADRWICRARVRPDELEVPTGLDLPEGPYETLGGFVLERLGHLPVVGDSFEYGRWSFEVRRMDGRRVAEVLVTALPTET